MNADDMLTQLQTQQDLLQQTVKQCPESDYKTQYHPDLSPTGWHLGHCVYTEIYWIREILMGDEEQSAALKAFYTPELSRKPQRSNCLPAHDVLCAWAEQTQQQDRTLLSSLMQDNVAHVLMQNNYLIRFLLQHYAQHNETIKLILAQQQLQIRQPFTVSSPLQAQMPGHETRTVNSGEYSIGNQQAISPYDNEKPAFSTTLEAFHIATEPVSNAEFLAFMEAGAYQLKEYWSDPGWDWCARQSARHPDHWRTDQQGLWYGHEANGPYQLAPAAPVYGLNYYEACAYASWAGARLPHEYEWEIAHSQGILKSPAQVWQWCANNFHPYAGFRAFPYDGYSMPYFDDSHFTLRGGCCYTQAAINRLTFRNYYQADKRHIHAGIRLAFASDSI